MTAAVTVEGGDIGASRGARIRSGIALVYVCLLCGITMARSMTLKYIITHGDGAAARLVATSLACICFVLLVATVRAARVTVDDDGIRWGWGGIGFRLTPARIATARVYEDATAIVLKRGSVWYLSARDYTPYPALVAGLRRARLAVVDEGRRAPLRARLQAYGVALDVLLVLAVLGATLVFLVV